VEQESPEQAISLYPLRSLPDGTVIDREIDALDDDGRPVFNLLQNFNSESGRIRYFVGYDS
jgi:hypothetical protein